MNAIEPRGLTRKYGDLTAVDRLDLTVGEGELFALLVVKELTMFVLGSLTVKRKGTVHSAKWYGKLCTVVLESALIVLVLFPNLPERAVAALLWVCAAVMLFSLLMYTIFWIGEIKRGT